MANPPRPKRGEVWLVQSEPSVGSEIRKTRPAIVMNLNGIGRLPLCIVVPLTDWKVGFATFSWLVHVPASYDNGLTKDSGADAFQVKSVSDRRFVRKLGDVDEESLGEIAASIALCVGFP